MIEEKIQNNIENKILLNSKENKSLLIVEYSFLGKLLALLLRMFIIYFGFFSIHIDNIFMIFIGFICIPFGILDFINIFTFYRLIFYQDKLVKEHYFFGKKHKKMLNYSESKVMVSKSFFGGTLVFWEKNKRLKTMFLFNLDLFPIKNNEFIRIKKILIEKNVIKGDENEWNY